MSGGSNQYNYGTGEKNRDWIAWALVVFLFAIGAWPIALILLFTKLSDRPGKKKKIVAPEASGESSHRGAQAAARKMTRTPAMKSSNAKWMKIIGGAVTVIGVLALGSTVDTIFWIGIDRYLAWELLQKLAWVAAGGGLFFAGKTMDRRAARYQKYMAVIGTSDAVSMNDLAEKLGIPRQTVEKDLARMIERGFFGLDAYLNVAKGYFFRSGQVDVQFQEEAAKKEAPPKEAEEGYSGILRNIRRANDQIADPELSAKIDRIETITARIFRAVEEDPKKKDRIGTFFDYYLPTTQKLLDSYAEFEAAGIEGDNLRQAKQRIEDTMDSIIEGFERQLDMLYAADFMDVDSDIRVMESMLNRDGASVAKDFGLGQSGTAAASREEKQ